LPEEGASGRFAGLDVVVTGGTGGLGRGLVAALVDEGARCWIPNVDPRLLADFELAGHAQVRVVEGVDLMDEHRVAEFYRGVGDVFASIHLVGGFRMAPLAETSAGDFRKMMDLNALTVFLCSKAAVEQMRAAAKRDPARRGGRIVNVAARPALEPTGGMLAYAASKSAVVSLTQSLAEELKPEGIWVNAVAPSIMDTPDNRKAMPKADFSRWPKVSEVARAILYLASLDNALTTGHVMPVYGYA
jgi:NAD(P)-dependent dehydrogenase (short-subunit alcohol dehydrogenase family)